MLSTFYNSKVHSRMLYYIFQNSNFSAARDLKKANENGTDSKTFDGVFFAVNSPRKDIETLREKTPRKSLNGLLKPTSAKKRCNDSPGLPIMKISQKEKLLQTAVSILKLLTDIVRYHS